MITLRNLTPYTGDVLAPSPNHDARKSQAIEGIVLHATQDGGHEARSLSWMRSPQSRVSCHLLVSRNGRVTRLVGDRQRAWHAGLSWWRGTSDVNSVTLGIEIANRNDGEPFTDAQYARVAAIVAYYCRQGLSLDDVVSHEEIAPGRRTDPVGWNWDRFRTLVRAQLRPADVLAPPIASVRPPVIRGGVPRPSITPSRAPAPDHVLVSAVAKAAPAAVAPPKQRVAVATVGSKQRAPVPVPPPKHAVPTTPKPVLHSRTLWLNGLTSLAAGAAIVGETVKLAFGAGLTLPEDFTKWVLFGVGLVNIILRLRTTQPLACGAGLDCPCPDAPSESPPRAPAIGEARAAVGLR